MTPNQTVYNRIAAILRPKERLNIWQWADRKRYLAKGVSAKARHGKVKYNSALTPHQREPQEAPLDPTVQCTVLIGASQTMGKTEIINNVSGYHIEHDPTPQIVMYPTIGAAEKWSKKKFTPMIEASPCFEGLFRSPRSRDSGNTILVKEFIGGCLFCIGAESTSGLRAASGRLLIGDEIDTMEETKEGDPVELLFKRGESFPDAIRILSSTPTYPGAPIDYWFKQSDQRYWFVPCAKCDHSQTYQWKNVSWPANHPEQTVYLCEKCACALNDKQRLDMYFAGAWKPTAEFNGIRGYHLNGIYCPWPAQKGYNDRLHQMAVEHLRATRKGRASVKVWVNTFLAETFIDEAEPKPEWKQLFDRREVYGLEEVPMLPREVCLLTSSVDVHPDRLEVEIVGRGLEQEIWGIEKRQIFGNVQLSKPWEELDDILDAKFAHPCGSNLRVAIMVVDIGDGNTADAVRRFVKKNAHRRVYAVKGSSTPNAPILATAKVQKKGPRIQIFTVGTDAAKSTLYSRMNILAPGPRFMHFPKGRGYDEEYFQQLTAESCKTIYKHGVPYRQWNKDRERNEALDTRAYEMAAEEILNPNYRKLMKLVEVQEKPEATPAPPAKFYYLNPEINGKGKTEDCKPLAQPEAKTKVTRPTVARPRKWKINGW